MADFADKSSELSEQLLDIALQNKKPEGPTYNGKCFFCGEPVEQPKRWCDAECRDLYEKYGRSEDYHDED